jgi:hypothetical protein
VTLDLRWTLRRLKQRGPVAPWSDLTAMPTAGAQDAGRQFAQTCGARKVIAAPMRAGPVKGIAGLPPAAFESCAEAFWVRAFSRTRWEGIGG